MLVLRPVRLTSYFIWSLTLYKMWAPPRTATSSLPRPRGSVKQHQENFLSKGAFLWGRCRLNSLRLLPYLNTFSNPWSTSSVLCWGTWRCSITSGTECWFFSYASFEWAEAVNFILGKPQVFKNSKKTNKQPANAKPSCSPNANSTHSENEAIARNCTPGSILYPSGFLVQSLINTKHLAGMTATKTLTCGAHWGCGQLFKEVCKKIKEGTVQLLHTNKQISFTLATIPRIWILLHLCYGRS